MIEVLETILTDEAHPGDSNGKAVQLICKFSPAPLVGSLRKAPGHGNYVVRTMMAEGEPKGRHPNQQPKAIPIDVYLKAEDIAHIIVPVPENKIAIASLDDISKYR